MSPVGFEPTVSASERPLRPKMSELRHRNLLLRQSSCGPRDRAVFPVWFSKYRCFTSRSVTRTVCSGRYFGHITGWGSKFTNNTKTKLTVTFFMVMDSLMGTYAAQPPSAETGYWNFWVLIVVNLEDPGVDGKILLRWIFRKWDVGVWTGSSWLRIGTGGALLWMR